MADTTDAGNAKLSTWREVTGIASGISIILGVIIAASNLMSMAENSKRAGLNLRLSALSQVKEFLKQDVEVRRRGKQFMDNKLPDLLQTREQRVKASGTGEALYLSPELEDFAAMHYHYEQMGALVKLGYIEFPLIFEIIAFPDAYMDAVEPLRATIAANWKGPGDALPDLGENIRFLKRCYEKSRAQTNRPPSCP